MNVLNASAPNTRTKISNPEDELTNLLEESNAIDRSSEILFEKKDGLDQLLPAMADKFPQCQALQIHTAIMFFFSFSTYTIKTKFPKYLGRINPDTLPPSLHMHYLALQRLQKNDFESAFTLYCQLTQKNPQDQLAILMLETVGFMAGKFEDMVAPYENLYLFHADNSTFLGMLAFLYSHIGRHREAKAYIEIALKKSPHNAWVQHVYAHTLSLPKDINRGIKFLEKHALDWPKQNRFFEGHNWMHLCILYLQQVSCNVNFILQLYSKHIWGKAKSFIFEQNNAFLTLFCLELAQQHGLVNLDNKRGEVDQLWTDLATYAEPFMRDYFTPYLTVTAILTVAKVDMVKAELALKDFRTFAKNHFYNPIKYHAWYEIGLPILEGCMAYLRGNYALAKSILEPVHNKTIVMGHSDEQRSIFNEVYQLAKQYHL